MRLHGPVLVSLALGAAHAAAAARLPLCFVENRGQVEGDVAYYLAGRDTTFYFGADGVAIARVEAGRRHTVRQEFLGSHPCRPLGSDAAPATMSYFRGDRASWVASAATYRRIAYEDLWPGIDLVFTVDPDRLKYAFHVSPGADARQVRLLLRGASTVFETVAGQLAIDTPLGSITDERPESFQTVGGCARDVPTAYHLEALPGGGGWIVSFELAGHDPAAPLVIDPAILLQAGYLGGSGDEDPADIAIDSAGNLYVAGSTTSTELSFPAAVGPDLTYNGGTQDAFVAKIDGTTGALVYCGYLGGSSRDLATDVAVDAMGNAYVTGYTSSTHTTFPVTVGPDLTHNGTDDVFIAKVGASGSSLIYSGFLGGSGGDYGYAIAVDGSGNAYVAGRTGSTEATFPDVAGPDLTYNGDSFDGFVAKVNAAGTGLVYCGYIGGSGSDGADDLAVDAAGNAYLVGYTISPQTTFPAVTGPDLTWNGNIDAWVGKVRPDGTSLLACGYVGGNNVDRGAAIALDGSGNAYIGGYTRSTEASFPEVVGPDLTYGGADMEDVFVAKVRADFSGLAYCGYLGGNWFEMPGGIAVDQDGAAYLTGYAASATFPATNGPDTTFNGGYDAFVAKVRPDGTGLVFSGFIGGTASDTGTGIAVDPARNVHVVGRTNTDQATFPVGGGGDPTWNGGYDAFVAKVTANADLGVTQQADADPAIAGTDLTYTITAHNGGVAGASGTRVVDTLPAGVTLVSAIASQGTCSGTGPVTCDLGSLAPGGSATVTLRVAVPPERRGTITNTATLSAVEPDPAASDNIAALAIPVIGEANLVLTGDDQPDPACLSGPLAYDLDATNNGPSRANAVTLTYQLPAGVTLVSATPTQGSCNGTSPVVCGFGTLDPGATASVVLAVAPVVAGTIQGSGSVAAVEADPSPSSNSVTLATQVLVPPPVIGSTLSAALANGGTELRLTWGNVAGAADYVVRQDASPDGPFSTIAGIASDGAAGLLVPATSGSLHYLVAARNACGESALH